MTLLTLAAMTLFVRLGVWQWHRGELKSAQWAQFAAGSAQRAELGTQPVTALPRYSLIRVQGRYDTAHQFLLDNLSHAGSPGYEALTPLILSDGRVLMVNRGWLAGTGRRSVLPDIGLARQGDDQGVGQGIGESGHDITVTGRLDDLPVVGIALGHIPPAADAPWPRLTSFPTMSDLSTALHRPLEQRQLLLGADQPFGYVRDWQPSGFGPGRHFSYAVQWWSFAALALVLYGHMNRQRT
jgi:surfeit locus 1 family protein